MATDTSLANGGYRIQPHFINRIEDAYGKVIYQNNLNMHVSVVSNQQESNSSAC